MTVQSAIEKKKPRFWSLFILFKLPLHRTLHQAALTMSRVTYLILPAYTGTCSATPNTRKKWGDGLEENEAEWNRHKFYSLTRLNDLPKLNSQKNQLNNQKQQTHTKSLMERAL